MIACDEDKGVLVRMPVPLKEQLTQAAVREGRSRNSEIVRRLQQSVEGERVSAPAAKVKTPAKRARGARK